MRQKHIRSGQVNNWCLKGRRHNYITTALKITYRTERFWGEIWSSEWQLEKDKKKSREKRANYEQIELQLEVHKGIQIVASLAWSIRIIAYPFADFRSLIGSSNRQQIFSRRRIIVYPFWDSFLQQSNNRLSKANFLQLASLIGFTIQLIAGSQILICGNFTVSASHPCAPCWGGRGNLRLSQGCLRACGGVNLASGSQSRHLRRKSMKRPSSQPFRAARHSRDPGGPRTLPRRLLPPPKTTVGGPLLESTVVTVQ